MVRKRILVVDDEPLMREFISETLRRRKYDVKVAIDGMDALDQLESWTADLVISDIKMPRMNGMELLEKLTVTYPSTDVIMITAYGTVDNSTFQSRLDIIGRHGDGGCPQEFDHPGRRAWHGPYLETLQLVHGHHLLIPQTEIRRGREGQEKRFVRRKFLVEPASLPHLIAQNLGDIPVGKQEG